MLVGGSMFHIRDQDFGESHEGIEWFVQDGVNVGLQSMMKSFCVIQICDKFGQSGLETTF